MTSEPQYLESPQVAKLFDLVMHLATELHVAKQRLLALEALLVRDGSLGEQALDRFTPTTAEAGAIDAALADYSARLVRVITEAGPAEQPLRAQWESQLASS